MSSMIDPKSVGNTIYEGAVLSALTVGYAMAFKYFLKANLGDPSKPNLTEAMKLTGAVSLALITKGYLEKEKIIPDDPF